MNTQRVLPSMLKSKKRLANLFGLSVLSFWVAGAAAQSNELDLAQQPLFLSQPAKPVVMLAMSVDHQLFRKAYSDYANLDGGPLTIEDTSYRNDFTYYGYFDSNWCYSHNDSYFTPEAPANNFRCNGVSGDWSGNFLNWASMTRMDIVRRVLFGGKRSTDTEAQTVLERAYLPADAHSFAKVYRGSDTNHFTPYTGTISLCNTSYLDAPTSSAANESTAPWLRVAQGDHRQWALQLSSIGQCQYTSGSSPSESTQKLEDYQVRVQACGAEASSSSRCKAYTDGEETFYKPVGLLQRYETSINFGLVSGSYRGNLKGGVLRKPASLMVGNDDESLDEIRPESGVFTGNEGIISNISNFTLHGWGWHNDMRTYEDCHIWNITVDDVKSQTNANRRCSNWGNPLSEIYLETLRYIAGAGDPTAAFNLTPGSETPSGVTQVENWDDPFSIENWCATCSVVVLSTGLNSFDGDDLGSVSDIEVNDSGTARALSVDDIHAAVDDIGVQEYVHSPETFAGSYLSGGGDDGRCTPKTLARLSDAEGVCPELPGQEGDYAIAGLSYLARTHDLRPDITNNAALASNPDVKGISVDTYAVNLAENIPSFEIPVSNSSITLLPYCDTTSTDNSNSTDDDDFWPCSFLDVEVEFIRRNASGQVVGGSYIIWWEDGQFGSDHDRDVAQRLKFCVGSECDSGASVSYRGSSVVLKDFYACPGDDFLQDPSAGTDAENWANQGCNATVNSDQVRVSVTLPATGPGNDYRVGYTITGASDVSGVAGIAMRRSTVQVDRLLLNQDSALTKSLGRNSTVHTAGAESARTLEKPLYYAAKYGSFNETEEEAEDPNYGGTPQHASGDSRKWDTQDMFGNEGQDGSPDNYFNVSNPALLEASLERVFDNVMGGVASGSAAASNATRLEAGAVVYQARFSSIEWSGELRAFDLEPDGGLGEQRWSTDDPGKIPSADARFIYTHNGTNGVNFRWDSLSPEQQAALGGGELGMSRLAWLRGAEVSDLRERGDDRVLGSIINSAPVFAGGSSSRYERFSSDLGGDSYAQYVADVKSQREAVVYVNSNGGKLHGFSAETGDELFAYVPSSVYDKLRNLTMPNFGSNANPSEYVVDGQLFVGDAYINGSWRSILVGTLGAGGRGVFALDVTDPSTVSANNLVLFELTEDDYPELGYALGQPLIAPVGDRWKLILGNGYNSDNGDASLLVIDLEEPLDGAHSKAIVAESQPQANGLAAPALLLGDSGVVSHAYAGDLLGNLWKFDLEGNGADNWGVDYRLYVARDPAGNRQPITASPVLGLNKELPGSTMVYFGTGKYFERTDNDAGSTIHSFYALADTNSGLTIGDGDLNREVSLHKKTIISQNDGVRVVDGERTEEDGQLVSAVKWNNSQGWFLDLVEPGAPAVARGERVISRPILAFDRLIFPTLTPSEASCERGGSSWLMELVAVGDRRFIDHSMLGESGIQLDDAVLELSNFIRSGDKGFLPVSDVSGSLDTREINLPKGVFGRQSWRQLQ